MIGTVFTVVVAIAALIVAYMCGRNGECKANACFRNSNKKD